jgi:predicted ATP-dependent protease
MDEFEGEMPRAHHRLPVESLRRATDPATVTAVLTEAGGTVPVGLGQERAEEALRFALAMNHVGGYHVFLFGQAGTGRHAIALHHIGETARRLPAPEDLAYRYDFSDPQRPRLLKLPAGTARRLSDDLQNFTRQLEPAVNAAFEAKAHQERIEALESAHKERESRAIEAIVQACAEDRLKLLQTGDGWAFVPVDEAGQPLAPERYEALPAKEKGRIEQAVERWRQRLVEALDEFPAWREALYAAIRRAEREALEPVVRHLLTPLREKYAELAAVTGLLDEIERDILDGEREWLEDEEEGGRNAAFSPLIRYQIHVLAAHEASEGAPVVFEDNPSYANLVGWVETLQQLGERITHFQLIRAGTLVRARGGFLLLDAERLLAQPAAWGALKRALQRREVRIEPPPEAAGWGSVRMLEPEPIDCPLKVVLIGTADTFHALFDLDDDFQDLFKIPAEAADDVPRTPETEAGLARLLLHLARENALRPPSAAALATVLDQAAREAEHAHRLTLRTRTLVDLLREADALAHAEGAQEIGAAHVRAAARARERRLARHAEETIEAMLEGELLITTEGARAGQINGLVVVDVAHQSYGYPVRITATVRLGGEGEVVDIERETELGGAIHSKGVMILASFLAGRFGRHQPLSLSASLVMEQSYAFVEGDSASLAELCALLSAISGLPLAQGMAVTGSVNQFGEVQVIGGVNEKIEGFFTLCARRGLTGEQGVIIPRGNVRHLMLREEVIEAVRAGKFAIWAVETVDEAMALLTGLPAGAPDGRIPSGRPRTVNEAVAAQLRRMAEIHAAAGEGTSLRRRWRRREKEGGD